jgi:rhamnose utilization protein RhaD (predicted bifunctional aldolase and dehydrogenase)/NAD(P)-dependent dehydrogenase (short-subunit alcohol dehydrogenase family)
MRNDWSQDAADAVVARYAAAGVPPELALRTYSARLLGVIPELVMHGGGNTSVKLAMRDLHGEEIETLCIKGSGWDLATIEPQGHPAVRLEPLRRLRALNRLSDEDMVNVQRQNLLDTAAPNPSVEALLHANLPHRFVDHTHAIAVCAVTDQPNAERVAREVWGERVAVVPYVMPGFALAKLAAEIFEQTPDVEGLVLLKHGLITFGDTAQESYERMIRLVSAAEDYIAARAPQLPALAVARGGETDTKTAAELLPQLRGALSGAAGEAGAARHWVLDLRCTDDIACLLARPDLAGLLQRGVSTPDHVIRTKGWPVLLPKVEADGAAWGAQTADALAGFQQRYAAYFERGNLRVGGGKRRLDPLPRLFAIPGLGLAAAGATVAEARIVADLGEAWAATALRAEAVGRFEPVSEPDLFDMEYWSLEQAKLGKGQAKPLAGRVVVVTGGGGAIGAATLAAFAAQGAEIAALDLDATAAEQAVKTCGRGLALACDVTDPAAVARTFARIASQYGGIDIVVSNAGAAWTGRMAELSDETLRRSFELNFFAHQNVAQAAAAVFRRQRMGGALLFNVSKQAVNPGDGFGAYGTPKAALLALMRQYALELGGEGVRVNAVNADRIRSGLLTDEMIASRAQSRGLDEADYMAGNLLGQEVRAEDVAQAFVFQALMPRTTGAVFTVDGGNVAAMLR